MQQPREQEQPADPGRGRAEMEDVGGQMDLSQRVRGRAGVPGPGQSRNKAKGRDQRPPAQQRDAVKHETDRKEQRAEQTTRPTLGRIASRRSRCRAHPHSRRPARTGHSFSSSAEQPRSRRSARQWQVRSKRPFGPTTRLMHSSIPHDAAAGSATTARNIRAPAVTAVAAKCIVANDDQRTVAVRPGPVHAVPASDRPGR